MSDKTLENSAAGIASLIELTPEEQSLQAKRMAEALIFAAEDPISLDRLSEQLPPETDIPTLLKSLEADYKGRGIELVQIGDKVLFRTAGDLAFLLRREVDETRKLSRAGVETMAIIAYHQPVTRAEIEDIRGVTISKGTLDVLMEAGWVRPMGRKRTPGRPVTYGTTNDFLVHFGIESLKDLPGMTELKAAGLLDTVDEALDAMQSELTEKKNDPQIDLEDAILAQEKSAGSALVNPSDFEEDDGEQHVSEQDE